MKRKRNYGSLLLLMTLAIMMFYIITDVYYRRLLDAESLPEETTEVCLYQFDMIVDNLSSTFWQAVYQSGKAAAQEEQVLLNLKGAGEGSVYDKLDYMRMSIAAQVDGIIIENNGEEGLDELIDEAAEAGIPVVTVMSDASYSTRQSFIGVSDYQLGQAYGEQAALYADQDTQDILILMNRMIDDKSQSQLYSQIYSAVSERVGSADDTPITISMQNLLPTGPFDAEEAIRDIFQEEEGPPDMLICMDEETTECARAALLDFNLAGQVKIIGYYTSENVLDAVTKGLIASTCSVDTGQLGRYAVQALLDYKHEGRVNSYYNVDIHFVDAEEAAQLQGRTGNANISLE